jgi:Xaa-Pro dipeptidase
MARGAVIATEYPGLTPTAYQERVERLRHLAGEAGIHTVLLRSASSLLYFAGISELSVIRPTWMVVPPDGECSIVLPRIETPGVAMTTWVRDLREWVEWPDPTLSEDWADPLVAVLEEHGSAGERLGIEKDTVTASAVRTLKTRLKATELADAGPLVAHLRRIKEPVELELMRIGGRVAEAQLAAASAALAEGVPEYELALAARAAGTRVAAEALGPDYHLTSPVVSGVLIMGAGPSRSAMAHPRASTYRIGAGDIVQLCFCGPNYFTYQLGFDRPIFSDTTRLTRDQHQVLDVGLHANQAALEAVRPGVSASDVHAAARQVVERAGVAEQRAHRTGRGVGASEAEPPELRESDSTVLEPGMTFTVEPGVYVPGVAGVRFGDTVAVTETGYEMLTPAPYGWGGL